MSTEHLICIVSDRIIPNWLSIKLRKPNTVHLVYTPKMKHNSIQFFEFLKKQGIWTRYHEASESNRIADGKITAQQLIRSIRQKDPDAKIVFNASGGTEGLSLAFISVIENETDGEVIYTNPGGRLIE